MLNLEEASRPVRYDQDPPLPKPAKQDTVAAPQCTTEGVGYTLECWTCRLEGTIHRYIGETSRSPFQRGKEHDQEIKDGKKTHPMTIHFLEAHNGQQQEVLMGVVKKAATALERQVWESVTIDSQPDPSLCLKLKSE